MDRHDALKTFYMEHIPGARMDGHILKAPCPLCPSDGEEKPGVLVAYLDPDSLFLGYYRCLNRCHQGGFSPYFAKIMNIDPQKVPGFDPEREFFIRDVVYPNRNLNADMKKYWSLMGESEYAFFEEFGVSGAVVDALRVGYNGRYLVYPYYQVDGNCYAARCIVPGREDDSFWHGDEAFFQEEFQIFNVEEIDRCESGAIFITEGENNLLVLKELGFPSIAVPSFNNLETLAPERLDHLNHVFLVMNNTPEAQISARNLATRLGYKARILKWPSACRRGYNLLQLVKEKGKGLRSAVSLMLKSSESYSPFSPPEKEHMIFTRSLEREKGKSLLGLQSGLERLDSALNGIRGINIMGGQPKAGKSCFFMQVTTNMAEKNIPVIYYDFENGRQKIYNRTLCRLSRLSEGEIRRVDPEPEASESLKTAHGKLRDILNYFRVVTDRKLNPDIMRRQIDFLRHETRSEETLVVVDSLHKLPFKNLSERRTGIDEWLRHMEAIRDDQNVTFLVISELSRSTGGRYSEKPDLASFKESGDIEYSADNAMILLPEWDPLDPISTQERKSTLWLVASRENSPGKIAEYILEYPYWGFREL